MRPRTLAALAFMGLLAGCVSPGGAMESGVATTPLAEGAAPAAPSVFTPVAP